MRKTRYKIVPVDENKRPMIEKKKDIALMRANIFNQNKCPVKVFEIISDGEDIYQNNMIYDGTDE